MKFTKLIKDVRQSIKENIDEKTVTNSQKFFKEKIKFYGTKVPTITTISKHFFEQIKNCTNAEIFSVCEKLWKSGYLEESFIACNWSYYIHEKYTSNDFKVFEKWLNRYVNNWASCDTLCNHTIGTFIEMFPEYVQSLKNWTQSENRWVKRGSAVTLIIPARKGLFLHEIFDISDSLFYDKDDLIQKGYGWLLKAASEAHQKEVFNYIMNKKSTMPRISLRYAIEKMPEELKKAAMSK